MQQKVLILVNTGTPDAPDKKSVRRYLSEFLNDPYVIDLPWIARKILVNLIIVPFRTRHSADLYSRLWTTEGSPLKVNMDMLVEKLNYKLRGEYLVTGAMRYGNPSITSVLQGLPRNADLTVLPLYPQYATATTGSVKKEVLRFLKREKVRIKFIEHFYSHQTFIRTFTERIKSYNPNRYDHILFSYHSLPKRHIIRIHPNLHPERCQCEKEFPKICLGCYKAMCYQTTRLIIQKLDLHPDAFTTTFQSRLSKNWIGPFTDQVVRDLVKKGKKRILVVAPSFVADCLETIIELKEEYSKMFSALGGLELDLVESLNYGDDWVESIMEIIK